MSPKSDQIEKFKKAARQHECDESEDEFDAKLKKIVTAPPPKDTNDKDKNPPK